MENCGDLSWDTFWISLRTCLIVSLRLGWMPVVPDVTVVLVSPCCSDRGFVEPQSFSLSKSLHIFVQTRRKR